MTLMAQVEQARNRHQESNQQLLAASGTVKGLAAAAWIENRRLRQQIMRQQPPTPRTIMTSAEVTPGRKLDDTDRIRKWREFRDNPSVLLPSQIADSERRGRGPQSEVSNGRMRTDELSHEDTSRRRGGGTVVPRSVVEHAALDRVRYRIEWDPDVKRLADSLEGHQAAIDHHNSLSAEERARLTPDQQERLAHHRESINRHNNLPAEERERIEKIRDTNRENFWNQDGNRELDPTKPESGIPQQRNLRQAGRALGVFGLALDAYSLKEAWDADGGQWGENTTSTVGGVAGGWAGAAAGAALGTAFIPIPVVGTVVGGAIGGIIGSGVGSEIAGGIGSLFD